MKQIVLPAFLCLTLGACIQLAHLEKTPPTRTMEFTGSHEKIAKCVEQNVGGKVRSYPDRIAVFDAVNHLQPRGVTHYALIVRKTGDGRGVAEFRKRPEGPIQQSMITRFWTPVERCIAQEGSTGSGSG